MNEIKMIQQMIMQCMLPETERTGQKERPKKTWWDCVRGDMES